MHQKPKKQFRGEKAGRGGWAGLRQAGGKNGVQRTKGNSYDKKERIVAEPREGKHGRACLEKSIEKGKKSKEKKKDWPWQSTQKTAR